MAQDPYAALAKKYGGRIVDAAPEVSTQVDDPFESLAKKYGGRIADTPEPSSMLRRAGDYGVTLLKGAASLGPNLVGIADIPFLGRIGKLLEDQLGYDPSAVQSELDALYTPEQREANQHVSSAEDFGGMLKAVYERPSTIPHAVVESLPAMGMGGVLGRGVTALAPKLAAYAGGIGEGLMAAGSAADQTRQQSPDGVLSPKQAALNLAAGVGTTAFGIAGSKFADKLGITDIDSLLAGATTEAAKRSLAKRVIYGAFSEGVLEELPQSVQEQILSNAANNRPLDEGVAQSAVLGTLAGAVMGGGAQFLNRTPPNGPPPPVAPPPTAAPPINARPGTPPTAQPPVAQGPIPPPNSPLREPVVPPPAAPIAPVDPVVDPIAEPVEETEEEKYKRELLRRYAEMGDEEDEGDGVPTTPTPETPLDPTGDDVETPATDDDEPDAIDAALEEIEQEEAPQQKGKPPRAKSKLTPAEKKGLYQPRPIAEWKAVKDGTVAPEEAVMMMAMANELDELSGQPGSIIYVDQNDTAEENERKRQDIVANGGRPFYNSFSKLGQMPNTGGTELVDVLKQLGANKGADYKSIRGQILLHLASVRPNAKTLPGTMQAVQALAKQWAETYDLKTGQFGQDVPRAQTSSPRFGVDDRMDPVLYDKFVKPYRAGRMVIGASQAGYLAGGPEGRARRQNAADHRREREGMAALDADLSFDPEAIEAEAGSATAQPEEGRKYQLFRGDSKSGGMRYAESPPDATGVGWTDKADKAARLTKEEVYEALQHYTGDVRVRDLTDYREIDRNEITGYVGQDENDEAIYDDAKGWKRKPTGKPPIKETPEQKAAREASYAPPTRRPPVGVPRADMDADRPRRNAGGWTSLEDALSPGAKASLDKAFKDPTRREELQMIRALMEEHGRLSAGEAAEHITSRDGEGVTRITQADVTAAIEAIVAATEQHFTSGDGDLSSAEWRARQLLAGNESPDRAELLEFQVFPDAADAAALIWDTLDPKTASFDTAEFNTAFGEVEFRKPADELFPEPTERVTILASTKNAPAEMPQDEADAIVQSWKDEAKRIGEEEDHSNEVVLSLFDRTGQWAQPYKDAGYTVLTFDLENGQDLMDFGSWMAQVEELISEGQEIVGILAAPPCTSYSGAGAHSWAEQHDKPNKENVKKKYGEWAAEMFDTPLDYANTLVAVVKLIVQQANPAFYAMENPVGRIQRENGLPTSTLFFDPNAYGDPYTKRTQIWGEFNPNLPTARVEATEGSKISTKMTGFSKESKLQRSETPKGFAYAFFMANRPELLAQEAGADRDDQDDNDDDVLSSKDPNSIYYDKRFTETDDERDTRLLEKRIKAGKPVLESEIDNLGVDLDDDYELEDGVWSKPEKPAKTGKPPISKKAEVEDDELEDDAADDDGDEDSDDADYEPNYDEEVPNSKRRFPVNEYKVIQATPKTIEEAGFDYLKKKEKRPARPTKGAKAQQQWDAAEARHKEGRKGRLALYASDKWLTDWLIAQDVSDAGLRAMSDHDLKKAWDASRSMDRITGWEGGHHQKGAVDDRVNKEQQRRNKEEWAARPVVPVPIGTFEYQSKADGNLREGKLDNDFIRVGGKLYIRTDHSPGMRQEKVGGREVVRVEDYTGPADVSTMPTQVALRNVRYGHYDGSQGDHDDLDGYIKGWESEWEAELKDWDTHTIVERKGQRYVVLPTPVRLVPTEGVTSDSGKPPIKKAKESEVLFTREDGPVKATITKRGPVVTVVIRSGKSVVHEFETHSQESAEQYLDERWPEVTRAASTSARATVEPSDHDTALGYLKALGYDRIKLRKDGWLEARVPHKGRNLKFVARPAGRGFQPQAHNKTQEATRAFKTFAEDLRRYTDGSTASTPTGNTRESGQREDRPLPVVFRSGNTRSPSDLDGYIKARQPVGVTALMSGPVRERVIAYAKDGGKVFVDSGAFGNPAPNWPAIIAAYGVIIDEAGDAASNIYVVAPDKVGDGDGTLKLQEKYTKQIDAWIDAGARVIIPIQQGPYMEVMASGTVARFQGAIVGIPANKAAFDADGLRALIEGIKVRSGAEPFGVHLLGMGETNKAFQQMASVIAAGWPNAEISGDSNRTRALMSEGRPAHTAVKEQTDARADDEVDYDDPNGDTTEISGQFYTASWKSFTPAELLNLAVAIDLTVDEMTSFDEDDLAEAVDRSGLEDALQLAFFRLAKARMARKVGPGIRRDVIAEADKNTGKPPKSSNAPTFGNKNTGKPPTKNDEGQTRLPGDVGDVRDLEVSDTKVADLPAGSLTLKGEDAPESMRPKPPTLFDMPEDAKKDLQAGLDKIRNAFLGKKFSGIPIDEELIVGVGLIVKAYAKAGVKDAAIVWDFVREQYGALAGDLRKAFRVAWAMEHSEKPQVDFGDAKPSATPQELEQRTAQLREKLAKDGRDNPRPAAKPPIKAEQPKAGPTPAQLSSRERFGNETIGFGKHADVVIKDLATQHPEYAIWMVEKGNSGRAQKVADYLKDDPAFIRAMGNSNVTMTPEQVTLLDSYGLVATQEGTLIYVKGKTPADTHERKDIFKKADGRFDAFKRVWRFASNRLANFIADLTGLPRETGRARRKLAPHLTDERLRKLRSDASGRPDRSGFDGDLQQYVSVRTEKALQDGGAKAGIAKDVIDEQVEDVARINRAFQRGQKAFILASEPGTGKTFVLGGAIQELKAAGVKSIVYITQNKGLIAQAHRNLKAFDLKGVQFMTYAAFRKTNPMAVDALIFDEAHNIKNVKSAAASAQAIQGAKWMAQAKFTVMATATPYENPTQVQYLAPTGVFDEVFGEYHDFALAYGATAKLVDKENHVWRYDWQRTTTSDEDQKAARDWLVKEGLYTSRRIRLPKDQVDSRMVFVKGDDENAKLFDAINTLKLTAGLQGAAKPWVTNFQKRVLEASKVQVAIETAQKALDRGRYPIIFVETKAERILDVKDLQRMERAYNLLPKDERPDRPDFETGLPPAGIVNLLANVSRQIGKEVIHIPSAEDMIEDAFGRDDVAIYTGSVSEGVAQRNLAEWRTAERRVLVATMAKGGTGLSLHDEKGDHQTTQININMPWTATQFVQVAQRSARYGLKGKAEMVWLFANNIAMDKDLARRVGGRMADMGAIVHGERLEGSATMEDWNMEDVFFDEDVPNKGYTTSGSSVDGAVDEDIDEDGPDEDEDEDDGPDDDEEPVTYFDQEPTGPGEDPNEETEDGHVRGLELPELVELATELNKIPLVRKRMGKMLGYFKSRDGVNDGQIALHKDLFKEGRELELAQVLAHEIGHLIDWLPDYTLKRGNVLGRLRSLSGFLKHQFVKANGDIIEMGDIRKELTRVSDLWRPWEPETSSESHKKYRASGRELMADAMSALLTNPEWLQRTAPQFYKEFFDAMDQKADVKQAYYEMQVVMAMTVEERNARRLAADRLRVEKGSDKAVSIARQKLDKMKAARGRGFWLHLKSEFLDKHYPVIQRVKDMAKRGQLIPERWDPRYMLEERNYVGGLLKGWAQRNVNPLVEMLDKAEVSWHDFGLYLEYARIVYGDRAELANPGGTNPKAAKEKLDALAADVGETKMAVIKRGAVLFQESIKEVIAEGYEQGLYSNDTYKKMLENSHYATFRVQDYLDERVTASIKRQIGTFKDINNAADSTILKMFATLYEVQNQKAKRSVFDMLTSGYPGDIEDGGPLRAHRRATNRDLKPVQYWKQGVYHTMFVDALIADSLNNKAIGKDLSVVKIMNLVNSAVFRPLFTGMNPGFQTFNIARDFFRTWKNDPNMTMLKAAKRYWQAIPLARVRAFGLPDKPTAAQLQAWEDLMDAETHMVFSVTFNEFNASRHIEDTEIGDIMARVGATKGTPPRTGWRKNISPVLSMIEFIKNTGDFIETLPKAAAMYEARGDKGHIRDLGAAQRSFIRRKVGSPDYLAGGTWKPVTNELLLFSNAIAQAWRADYEVATDPKTRAGYVWKTASVNLLPKLLMLAMTAGWLDDLFGEWYGQVMAGVSEYDKTNYTIVPLGIDEKGQSIYLRLPQDDTGRVMGGLFWKLLRVAKGDKDVLETMAQVMDYTAGQIPSMTPLLGAIDDTVTFASGRNPYDAFRGRNLFTKDEFDARYTDSAALKKFMGWQFQQLGGSILWKFYAGETRPTDMTAGQKVLDLPIVSNIAGRWLRISDFGQHETLREVKQGVVGETAGRRLHEKRELNKAIHSYMALQPWERSQGRRYSFSKDIAREVYPDLKPQELNEKTHAISKKLFLGAVRGEADPLVEEVMSAGSNAEKKALIAVGRKSMTASEYQSWITRAMNQKVISEPLAIELRKHN